MFMSQIKIQLEKSWKKLLVGEFEKDYMKNLKSFLKKEYSQKKLFIHAVLNSSQLSIPHHSTE